MHSYSYDKKNDQALQTVQGIRNKDQGIINEVMVDPGQ
jgi:hypothetical protein